MAYRVHGRVRRSDDGRGIPGLKVKAYDVDWISADDYLGSDTTDSQGNFEIRFDRGAFSAGWFDPEGGPDIVLKIYDDQGRLVYRSRERSGAGKDTYFDVQLNPLDLTPLGAWLVANPRIANAIQWEDATGFRTLPNWTSIERDALREAYRLAEQGNSLLLADPPPNQLALADDDFPLTVLRGEDAWLLFLAHVAHALHLEIGGGLGWSARNYGDPELAVLFNSKYYFEWDAQRGGYNLSRTRVGGAAAGWPLSRGYSLLAPPKLVYDFLTANDLIAGDRLQTIGRVLEWSRQNLVHFAGALEAANAENQWQYRGLPPVSRILAGTLNNAYPLDGVQHRTAGCHGTNGFLKAVLRVVNIPVLYKMPEGTGHATPHFLSEARYLSHGDDPYNRMAKGDPPPYPATELLIDQEQFDAWFGDAVPPAERENNIGRRVGELAVQYLPDHLLWSHCQDHYDGTERAHDVSRVHDYLKKWYTVAELEATGLWSRIDQRIVQRGGCPNIPQV